MLQLQPGEYFAIVRQLADPNDTGTYYVRAFVRNARTDTLLDTVDLTDRTGQRFSKEWQVPSSTSSALYIAITTRVYTDSGYTTLSTDYSQEMEVYLVEDRIKHAGGGGDPLGGAKFRIDYDKLRQIVQEENARMLAEILGAMPNGKTITVGEVVRALSARFDGLDLSFNNLLSGVQKINVKPQVLLEPFLDKVREAANIDSAKIIETASDLLEQGLELKKALERAGKDTRAIAESLPELKKNLEVLQVENLPEWAQKPVTEIIRDLRQGKIKISDDKGSIKEIIRALRNGTFKK